MMVGMWAIMLALTVWAWWLAWRRRLFTTPAFLRAANWAIPAGYVAVTAGWITTEVGRQPFVVYGLLRTADAVTPTLTGGDVLASLLAYVAVYCGRVRCRRVLPRPAGPARPPGDARRPRTAARTSAPPGRSRPRPRRTPESESVDGARPRTDLDAHPRVGRVHVRPARRLRPRRRHPLSVRARRSLPRPHDGLRRADLGRQRDLARARRHRAVRGVSARVRDHHAGACTSRSWRCCSA